jgi:UDP-N-acetyl-D-glucosamine dehydrogenase
MTISNGVLPESAQRLIHRFESGDATIGVVGMGYVGLPLATVLAKAGYRVIGVDSDPEKVAAIQGGKSYVVDVSSQVLGQVLAEGRLSVTVEYAELGRADGVSICVPTPLRKTGDPDLSYIASATEALMDVLHEGMAIVLESTTYPGTTRERMLPVLERTGLRVGEDIFLAFSPERVDPGRQDWTTANTPKVIGGITPVCTRVAAAMYGRAIGSIVPVSSTEVAEMTKLLENTFRAVNIALVNEVALMCHRLNLDVWEVIDAAATKPFGYMKFTPGPGLGGHCIPIDPLYLSWKLKSVKYTARFIELASEINTNMPRYVVGRLQDLLNEHSLTVKGAEILVMGVAYKPNVSDMRESPALDVIGLLQEKGARVTYYDPYVPSIEQDDWQLSSVDDPVAAAGDSDCVVIITDHSEVDHDAVAEAASLVFDTRNALASLHEADEKIVRL